MRAVRHAPVLIGERPGCAGSGVIAVPEVIAGAQLISVQPPWGVDDDVAGGAFARHAVFDGVDCSADLIGTGRAGQTLLFGVDLPDPRPLVPPWRLLRDAVHPEVHLCLDPAGRIRPQVVVATEDRDAGSAGPVQCLLVVPVLPVAALGGLMGEEGDAGLARADEVHRPAAPVVVRGVPSPHRRCVANGDWVPSSQHRPGSAVISLHRIGMPSITAHLVLRPRPGPVCAQRWSSERSLRVRFG